MKCPSTITNFVLWILSWHAGGHTVGVAHCSVFQNRLYNFQNTGQPDPTMNSTLLNKLRNICPQNSSSNNTTNLDQNPASSFIVDKSYYQKLLLHNGILLQVDQELALDSITKSTVATIANSNDFSLKFSQAMINLGAVQVLTGTQGEIRRSCRAVNKPSNGNSNGNFNLFDWVCLFCFGLLCSPFFIDASLVSILLYFSYLYFFCIWYLLYSCTNFYGIFIIKTNVLIQGNKYSLSFVHHEV